MKRLQEDEIKKKKFHKLFQIKQITTKKMRTKSNR